MARERGRESDVPGETDADATESGSSFNTLPDMVRKAFATGLSGFFFTEEALRKALGDTLPKDWADFAAEQSSRARADLLERVAFEFGRALENIDFAAVLSQLLEDRTLEIRAEVKLGPKKGGGDTALRFEVTSSDVAAPRQSKEEDEPG